MNEQRIETAAVVTAADTSAALPAPQLVSAFLLARHYGHEWATRLALSELWGLSPSAIARLVDERFPLASGERRGVIAPSRDGKHISHASGQLAWEIDPDGGVELEVRRGVPGTDESVVVLRAILTPSCWGELCPDAEYWCLAPSLNQDIPTDDPRSWVRFLPRHIDALRSAVQVFRGLNPNVPYVLKWLDSLQPRASLNERVEARERTLAMGLSSLQAIDTAQAVLEELRMGLLAAGDFPS